MDRFLSHTAALMLNARCQSIFLINNYDHMVSYLEVRKRGVMRGWGKERHYRPLVFQIRVSELYPCVTLTQAESYSRAIALCSLERPGQG